MKPKKILGFKNYGSIPHLSTSKLGVGDHFIQEGQERILTEKTRDKHDRIIVTEKYDGSNVGVCKKNGKIYALTRSGYEAKTSPYKQHHIFSDWVKEYEEVFWHTLAEGERLAGEWLLMAHGIKYTINTHPIVFFDYFNSENQRMIFDDLAYKLSFTPFQHPRVLSNKNGFSRLESCKEKLFNTENKIFDCRPELPEGLVYRCERKGKVDFLAKWVRSDFIAGKFLSGIGSEVDVYNIIKSPLFSIKQ